MCLYEYLIYIYEQDLALNNVYWLMFCFLVLAVNKLIIETVAMTSTAVSKRVFKSQTTPKWRWTNVQCNVCFQLILCICRYIFLLNILSGGKSCLVAPGVAVPPWATEAVLSPWLAADKVRVSNVLSHVVWWKYKQDLALNNVYWLIFFLF